MRLPDETYEYIKGEIADIFKRLNICQYPIDGRRLADKMGIAVVAYSSLSHDEMESVGKIQDGYCVGSINQDFIVFDDACDPRRQEMTIRHEIGHLVLGHDGNERNIMIQESEAKFFGKYLGAPPPLVHLAMLRHDCPLKEAFFLTNEAARFAGKYYFSWIFNASRNGLSANDVLILNQFGIKGRRLARYERTIEEVKDHIIQKTKHSSN
ncbi:MAG: ImmA/IrrE family metallo-endopeptidase [Clostridiales bacterium]|nr:ImmA/IrrE family metallo-endopeptidase [Clostridiales bacterium]